MYTFSKDVHSGLALSAVSVVTSSYTHTCTVHMYRLLVKSCALYSNFESIEDFSALVACLLGMMILLMYVIFSPQLIRSLFLPGEPPTFLNFH